MLSDTQAAAPQMTRRELEILAFLAEGMTNTEIAERTGLTLHTVKWYLKEIFSKLHVSNRTQAAQKLRQMRTSPPAPLADHSATGLPASLLLSPLVGRERELHDLMALLSDSQVRQITVYGIGGIGKTHLAVEAARQFISSDRRIVFASLARLDASGDPLAAVATTLKLPTGLSADPLQDLRAFFHDQPALLILDSFEHLDTSSTRITDLLAQTDQLTILVTARQALHLQGEVLFPLEGLALPAHPGAEAREASPAVQLFVQRARAFQAGFTPDAAQLHEIALICRMVNGMPLAIELAAGWIGMLDLRQIRERIAQNIDFLSSEARDREPRHRSIHAVFDWSWALLSATERHILVGLSVFSDSFTLEAAEIVTGADPRALKRLVYKALIQRSGEARFMMQNLLRQFISETPECLPDLLDGFRRRHAEYYLGFAARESSRLALTLDISLLPAMHAEQVHMVAGWQYALSHGLYDLLLHAASGGCYTDLANIWHECDVIYAETLAHISEAAQPILAGRLYWYRALFALRARRPEMMTYAEKCIALLADAPDLQYQFEAGCAAVLLTLGLALDGQAPDVLEPRLRQADALAEQIQAAGGNLYLELIARSVRPMIAFLRGELAEAASSGEAFFRWLPPHVTWHVGFLHVNMGECYLELGDPAHALAHFERAYSVGMAAGDTLAVLASAYFRSLHEAGQEAFDIGAHMRLVDTLLPQTGANALIGAHTLWYFAGTLLLGKTIHAQRNLLACLLLAQRQNDPSVLAKFIGRAVNALAAPDPQAAAALVVLAESAGWPVPVHHAFHATISSTRLHLPLDSHAPQRAAPAGLADALADILLAR